MKNHPAIFILLSCYAIVMVMTSAMNRLRPGIALYENIQSKNLRMLNLFHLAGIVVMLLPWMLLNEVPASFLIFPDRISIGQASAFLVCLGVISLVSCNHATRREQNASNISSLPGHIVIIYSSLRTVFLTVYEWFFRCLLLVSLCAWLGTMWGVGANVLLYVIIHAHKSRKEIIACIPFGVVLCVFTLWWQSIWPAVIFHLHIATMNEWPRLQQFMSRRNETAL